MTGSTDITVTDAAPQGRVVATALEPMIWNPNMSLHRQFVSAFVWLLVVVHCSTANAQNGIIRHRNDDSNVDDFYDPFCAIESDWFVPIDWDAPDQRPINSGWYFSYDRASLNVSRPRNDPQQLSFDPGTQDSSILMSSYTGTPSDTYQGDWSWGNRFDFGYMTPEGSGIWIVARKQDNPQIRSTNDNTDTNAVNFLRLDNQPVGETFVTLNGFNMWDVAINKVWRLPATPKGTILEPYVGPRYVRLRDHSDRTDVYTDTLMFPTVGVVGETRIDRLDFNYQTNVVTTDNSLFGSQFGLRSRWRRGRWQIVSDIRGMAFFNRRNRERIALNEIQQLDWTAVYVADGLGGGILGAQTPGGTVIQSQTTTTQIDQSNEFVYGGEFHLESTFEVTQGFALRAGLEIIVFGDGIGRGLVPTSESLVMTGYSLGFSLNR